MAWYSKSNGCFARWSRPERSCNNESWSQSLAITVCPLSFSTVFIHLTFLTRFKLKFSPDKVDTMVVQAIALLDDLDKEINIYAMRVKVSSSSPGLLIWRSLLSRNGMAGLPRNGKNHCRQHCLGKSDSPHGYSHFIPNWVNQTLIHPICRLPNKRSNHRLRFYPP